MEKGGRFRFLPSREPKKIVVKFEKEPQPQNPEVRRPAGEPQLPDLSSIMRKYNLRSLHGLDDVYQFGLLTPEEAEAVRRHFGYSKPQK